MEIAIAGSLAHSAARAAIAASEGRHVRISP